jgi:putative methionine-R-sulfoxide reductase with GAF domain
VSAEVLEALDRILEGGGEPDDVLREAVQALADSPGITWAGIAFLDQGTLVLGPTAGEPGMSQQVSVPIAFQGSDVGELRIDGRAERAFLERAAILLSGHVLIGWDTRGEAWDP